MIWRRHEALPEPAPTIGEAAALAMMIIGCAVTMAGVLSWCGCATTPKTASESWGPRPGIEVDCVDTSDCWTVAQRDRAEQLYRDLFPNDPHRPQVKLLPAGALVTGTYGYKAKDKVSATHGRWWIECESWSGWAHERIHLGDLHRGRYVLHTCGPEKKDWCRSDYTARERLLVKMLQAEFGGRR